ncbi:unnamed protein product [Protopolystoma xenopodis]|uniref:Protein kinase domain-containing protein n=1 Tax=Protopolystoma xenopodis TaxID=117903 RepID=A0A3S5FCI8_9PLAT|nr:unnamed protein product [Protopolystoma xenopodis]
MAGTVVYMAPEVLHRPRGPREIFTDPSSLSGSNPVDLGYGRACDIWSLACVVLELLTGRRPWYELTETAAIVFRLCSGATPSLPAVMPTRALRDPSLLTPCHENPGSDSEFMDVVAPPLGFVSPEAVEFLQSSLKSDPAARPMAIQLGQFEFVRYSQPSL